MRIWERRRPAERGLGREGEGDRGLELLKSLMWDEALVRRGRGWRHCGREGRGRGREAEPVEGALSREVRALPFSGEG